MNAPKFRPVLRTLSSKAFVLCGLALAALTVLLLSPTSIHAQGVYYPPGYPGSYPGGDPNGYPGAPYPIDTGGYPGGSGYPGGDGYPGGYPGGGSGWVPCKADGTLLQQGDPGYNQDGTVALMGSGKAPQTSNTYPPGMTAYAKSDSGDYGWWLSAFSPNALSTPTGGEYAEYAQGLALDCFAHNAASNSWGAPLGMFQPNCFDLVEWHDPAPQPPYTVGSVMADNSDTLTASFKYVGPGPVPDHASFLLNTNVSASAGADYNQSGLSSGLTATASAALGSDAITASLPDTPSASKSGRHLIRVAATGDIATISLPASVSGQAGNGTVVDGMVSGDGYHYFSMDRSEVTTASAGASATANAQYDAREVMITCGEIEASYYKGDYEHDSAHDTDRHQHQRNRDGSIQTDSAVVWSGDGWYGGFPFYGGNHYSTSAASFSAPSFSWTADGHYTQQDDLFAKTSTITDYISFGSSSKDFSQHSTFKLSVTDALDGATADNTFDVTWHLPREERECFKTVRTKIPLETRVENLAKGDIGLRNPSPPREIEMKALFDGAEGYAAGTGQEEWAGLMHIAGALADITDWKYHWGGESGDTNQSTGTRNDATEWQGAQHDNGDAYGGGNIIPASLASDPNGWMLCKMSLCVMQKETDQAWYCDGYTANGYDGNSMHIIETHHIDDVVDQAYFAQHDNPDGTPIKP